MIREHVITNDLSADASDVLCRVTFGCATVAMQFGRFHVSFEPNESLALATALTDCAERSRTESKGGRLVASALARGNLAEVTFAPSIVAMDFGRLHFPLTPREALLLAIALTECAAQADLYKTSLNFGDAFFTGRT